MFRCLLAVSLIVTLLAVLPGCGSSSSSDGPSFSQQVADAGKEPVADVRAKALMRIARRQAEAGDDFGAEETLTLADEACKEIEDAVTRSKVTSILAGEWVRLGSNSEGKDAARRALAAAAEIEDGQLKANALARAARAQVATKDTDGAVATLKQAEELAGQLQQSKDKVSVFTSVATGYAAMDNGQVEADRVIAVALELAATIEDARDRCEAVASVASHQDAMQQRDAAEKSFDLALQAAQQIEGPWGQTYAFCDLAESLSKAGFHAKAHKLLKEADKLAFTIPEPDLQSQSTKRVRTLIGELPQPK
ncbi:MAG: hypothetical protein HQ567_34995 [Candidatus Nealsonbacteria bacterium]|nr:hypothetical protein [Candidatus Nealsonbacteria bacterium]